ncbi:MAG: four helix bundle protein [Flavobacteriia bacterium]|nr:four helix bundle protein [Flavobacteriia bacterium]
MNKIKSYKDLLIWQKGISIPNLVYTLLKSFPNEEMYALTSQLKSSTISVPSNIAEGFGRNSVKSYLNFLKISRGSLFELETQLIITENQNYIQDIELYNKIMGLIIEEGKMINSYINKFEQNLKKLCLIRSLSNVKLLTNDY